MEKQIIIDSKKFELNPINLPFMTGFKKSLGDIFNKPNETIEVVKQILIVTSHYTTWHKIKTSNECFWSYWGQPMIEYDNTQIEGSDKVYFKDKIEVGRSAWLQESKYYKGVKNGIFANGDSEELHFYHKSYNLAEFMKWLDEDDKRYYLAYFSSTSRDTQFSYVLQNLK